MGTFSSPREEILLMLKKIVLNTLKDVPVEVYLFGSWARKEEKRTSDIDIGIQANGKLSEAHWIELREQIEESFLPYNVDIVDLSRVNAGFKEKVKREGILWSDYKNVSSRLTKH